MLSKNRRETFWRNLREPMHTFWCFLRCFCKAPDSRPPQRPTECAGSGRGGLERSRPLRVPAGGRRLRQGVRVGFNTPRPWRVRRILIAPRIPPGHKQISKIQFIIPTFAGKFIEMIALGGGLEGSLGGLGGSLGSLGGLGVPLEGLWCYLTNASWGRS